MIRIEAHCQWHNFLAFIVPKGIMQISKGGKDAIPSFPVLVIHSNDLMAKYPEVRHSGHHIFAVINSILIGLNICSMGRK